MSSSDREQTLKPGALVTALRPMRAWEADSYRGSKGAWILPGEHGLVVEVQLVGNQRRVRIVRDQRLLLFSCASHCVNKNWRITDPVTMVANLDDTESLLGSL